MSKEKIVLSLVAIILGLAVAGGAFYIYQMTQTIKEPTTSQKTTTALKPTPVPVNNNFLVVSDPKDEQLFSKRTITINGKTNADATVIVSTQTSDQVVQPSTNGDFTLTQTLEDGVNMVKITAIFQDGNEQTVTRTVTSTTEDF